MILISLLNIRWIRNYYFSKSRRKFIYVTPAKIEKNKIQLKIGDSFSMINLRTNI